MSDTVMDLDNSPVHCTPQPHLGRGPHGPAITSCVVDTETRDLWVHNGTQASKVMFCPYCGKPAGAVVVPVEEESLLDKIRHSAERLLGAEPAALPATP